MLRLLFFLLLSHAALALEVKEARWTFDGKAYPGHFNLLSVLVSESGPKAFEGELLLEESRGVMSFGAPYSQPLYVAPGTSRWVQFLPFVADRGAGWELRWGRGKNDHFTMDPPPAGPPGTVVLLDTTSAVTNAVRLKVFPDELFPTSVAATDALDQVVLDHVPRWDTVRREAFLDWVRAGGIVHLVRGASGHPVFLGDLAPLNPTAEKSVRYGAGRILQHDVARADLDQQALTRAGYPERSFLEPGQAGEMPSLYRADFTLLQHLASLTKPEVQWWLLYLLTIGYIFAVGPVHYFWSRKVDYRLAIAAFLGTVALFAVAFLVAGHRGSGEKQTSHALTIAHSLGGDRWDVRQWVSAFATKGDTYRLTHAGFANYYAAISESEQVAGRAFGGKDGHFDADIPLYSARPFLYRGVMSAPKPEARVTEWGTTAIRIAVDPEFARGIREVAIRRNGTVYTAAAKNGELVWEGASNSQLPEAAFFSNARPPVTGNYFVAKVVDNRFPFHTLAALFDGANAQVEHALKPRGLDSAQAQLFVLKDLPESLAMRGKSFSPGQGSVLYVIDVFRPTAPAATPVEATQPPR